jgi:hypothetical protein
MSWDLALLDIKCDVLESGFFFHPQNRIFVSGQWLGAYFETLIIRVRDVIINVPFSQSVRAYSDQRFPSF